jgi:hypothetical protein
VQGKLIVKGATAESGMNKFRANKESNDQRLRHWCEEAADARECGRRTGPEFGWFSWNCWSGLQQVEIRDQRGLKEGRGAASREWGEPQSLPRDCRPVRGLHGWWRPLTAHDGLMPTTKQRRLTARFWGLRATEEIPPNGNGTGQLLSPVARRGIEWVDT